MKKRPSVLSEDSTMLYNKWVSGIAKRDLQPEVITIGDIVNRFRNRQQAPKDLPYPLNTMVDRLGDIFIKCAELRRTIVDSLHNPVIKDDKNKILAVRELNNKIDDIQKQIFSCTDQLNKIVEK